MLSPDQQERYARHLLLDGFDQERLLAARISVRGADAAAHWAARYLAASGVGGLSVDVPAWHEELRALGPWLAISGEASLTITPRGGPIEGARAALDAIREVLLR